MKIAVNTLPISPGMTGIGAYTQALAASTADFGAPHSYLYITGAKGPMISRRDKKNLRHLVVESPDIFFEQLHLPTELAFWEIDLYHSPLFTCPIVDEIPSIITVHDAIPESNPDLCTPKFLRFYRSHIGPSLRAAIAVVTTSEFSKREIIRYLQVPDERIEVIYQGISPEFSPENIRQMPALRNRLNLPSEYILFVGMVEPRKNIERLIAAFGKIARETSDLFLVIVGRTDNPAYSLDAVIEKSGAARHIIRLGYVEESDLRIIYAGARMFAFPSLYEGFGRPVVEAMASGIPVVTANVTSLPEITEEAAVLVDPEDTDAIADGLLRVYRDENLRYTLIARGIERAKEFSYEKFGKRLVDFYDRIMTKTEA